MSTESLKCQSPIEYLCSQPPSLIEKLYTHSATCLCVFRALPILGKHYVMRLLFVEQPIPQAVVASWVNVVTEHTESVNILTRLHVWSSSPLPGGLPGWLINATFRENLKTALLGGGKSWTLYNPLSKDKHAPDIDNLDTYAIKKRWESVLHFMVNHRLNEGDGISKDTVQVLVNAGLIKFEDANDTTPVITAAGFQFLLMDTSSQVWYFLLRYLDTVHNRGMDLVQCLTFLFQLSFLTLGKDYSTYEMSDSLLTFLQHLREFGLVYQRKRKDGRFYPTRLAINLLNDQKETKINVENTGYIVVETNYRVYAYTDSPLQIALLALFTEMQYKFPKFVLGILTRESLRQALRSGITAEQIINFLTIHAHPESLKKYPVIPPTVMDQIKLWELERDRLLFKGGVLYSQFNSQPDFEILKKYANDLGVLIWDNPMKRVMVVSHAGHDEVRRFWKRHKKEH